MDDLPYSGLSRRTSADPEAFMTKAAVCEVAPASSVKTYQGQLDAAVKVACSYAESTADTLLVMAADHQIRGVAVENANLGDTQLSGGLLAVDGPFRIAGTDHNEPKLHPPAKHGGGTRGREPEGGLREDTCPRREERLLGEGGKAE